MSNTKTKKLLLRTETVRALSADELTEAGGGGVTSLCPFTSTRPTRVTVCTSVPNTSMGSTLPPPSSALSVSIVSR